MDDNDNEVLAYAAMVFLHRELAKVAEIRLTDRDFEEHDLRRSDSVHFRLDPETHDIILIHTQLYSDA